MSSATAQAFANIAFIKYWGNRDNALRLPANGSISMNLDGLHTRTTVSFQRSLPYDELIINGKEIAGPALERVSCVLDLVRGLARDVREGEANRRLGVLCLLYNRRRVNPDNPGLSLLDFERLMGFPREHLLFTVWFLKEMGYVRTENNGDYAVTAEGAVVTESQVPSHSSLNQFIYTPRIPAPESTRGKVNISEVRVATETVPMTN